MNKEAQRIAIAETCGWNFREESAGEKFPTWHTPAGNSTGTSSWHPNPEAKLTLVGELPDYLTDLNAMHEAEATLTDEQYEGFDALLCVLWDSGKDDDAYNRWSSATAAQRAEAFLRTLNLWTEE